MIRRKSEAPELGGLADLLEPEASAPAPDFAFADTIHVRDLGDEIAPPPSGPVIVNDPNQGTQCLTPLAFPLPPASENVSFSTRLRALAARTRHQLRAAFEELEELWSEAGDVVDDEGSGRALGVVRRLRAVWSFWEWERGDIARAAAIGCAVFAVAAVGGAVVLDAESGVTAAASGVVRAPHTVQMQHTGRLLPARMKAAR